MTLTRAFSLTLLASLATLVACGGSDSTPETPGAAGQTTTPPPGETPSTQDPGGQQTTPPPPPPLTAPPSEDKITEEFGVFVSAEGVEGAPGTRTQPLKSIQKGIALAQSTSRFVYVCTGTYHEAITVAQGIPIIGGFECGSSGWKLGTTVNARVESPTSPAVSADGIQLLTRIEGIDFIAPNGTEAAPTSIGLLANSSKGLWFERVNITAGDGLNGKPGVEPQGLTLQVVNEAVGGRGEYWPGREVAGVFTQDPGGLSNGGAGGTGACVGPAQVLANAGGPGGRNAYLRSETCIGPVEMCPRPYRWLTHTPAQNGTAGSGAGAVNGTDGSSASSPGALTATGFQSRGGTVGTNGTLGQGGDGAKGGVSVAHSPGGSGISAYTMSGGGGGVGGCYGIAGTAGQGGGASIGALLMNSAGITFASSNVTAKNGGAGGKGSFGSPATHGSDGGGTTGGAGRDGGNAGVSGSGAGGSSFAIATKGGTATLINGSKATAGAPGAGVPADTKTDAVGVTKTIPASVAGVAKDVETF